MKLTPKRKELLKRIDECDGRLQLLQITSVDGNGHSMLNELRRAGYATLIEHPTIKLGGYPVEAIAITEAGRDALGATNQRPPQCHTPTANTI